MIYDPQKIHESLSLNELFSVTAQTWVYGDYWCEKCGKTSGHTYYKGTRRCSCTGRVFESEKEYKQHLRRKKLTVLNRS